MGNLSLSSRATNYPVSTIRGLSGFAQACESKGLKVITLNLGAPDLPTPLCIRQAGADFLQSTPAIRYGQSRGEGKLIEELVKYYQDGLNISGVTSQNLMITQGASEALELVMYSVANSGDVILTPDPCYSNYGVIAYKYGIKLRPIPTYLAHSFHLMLPQETVSQAVARLGKLITPRTKAILWSSPSNPTGTTYSSDELTVLLQLSRQYHLFLVADEVYRLMSFAQAVSSKIPRAHSILDIAGSSDLQNIIVLDSASKMLSFCGGRVGIITASPEIITNLTNQASVRGCPSTISQASVAALNEVESAYFTNNRLELLSRRDYLYQSLSQLHDLGVSVSPTPPEGAFYLVVDLGHNIIAADYCQWLLTEYPFQYHVAETVFLTPMRMGKCGFYLNRKSGYSQVRIAYVLEKPLLERAVAIIKQSLPLYEGLRKDHAHDS